MTRQSLFEDAPITIADLKLKSKLIPFKYEDIVFSPIVQLMCGQCGMFGRNYRCPPFAMKYSKTREYLKDFNNFVFIISESDPLEYKKRYDNMKLKCGSLGEYRLQNLVGTQLAAINLGQSQNDLRTILRFIRARYEKYMGFGSASCIKCHPCEKQLKKPCAHPYDSFSSPEACGIDLYQILRNKEIEVQSPPISRYIAVCSVMWKE
jgi:predicted metal-binding protein